MCSTSPVFCRMCFSQVVAGLEHAEDMPVVGDNRCLKFDSVVLQRSAAAVLVVFDIPVVAGVGSYGPDGSDEQMWTTFWFACHVGPTRVNRIVTRFPQLWCRPVLSCSTSSSTLSGSGVSSHTTRLRRFGLPCRCCHMLVVCFKRSFLLSSILACIILAVMGFYLSTKKARSPRSWCR